jgi:hypothetical protein
VFAVSGVNTISFAIVASEAMKDGLLGFAVERIDPDADERYFMPGFKVFRSVIPQPQVGVQVSTFEHPVQSLLWDDFTAKESHVYTYVFHPIKGKPRKLDRGSPPLSIKVRTPVGRVVLEVTVVGLAASADPWCSTCPLPSRRALSCLMSGLRRLYAGSS